MKFQREKITTSWDITKNVEGGGFRPPALLGLKCPVENDLSIYPLLVADQLNGISQAFILQKVG